MARAIGNVDAIDFYIAGWAAEPGVANSIRVFIEVFKLNEDGSVPVSPLIAEYMTANLPRPDVPPNSGGAVIGDNHGFAFELPIVQMGSGGYLAKVRGLASEHAYLTMGETRVGIPGEMRFGLLIINSQSLALSFRYQGVVEGLVRPGSPNHRDNYESYCTAMWDGGEVKMWFAGGRDDLIYYATSAMPSGLGGFTVWGNYRPVIAKDRNHLDNHWQADPSVVKVPVPVDGGGFQEIYLMYYTADLDLFGGGRQNCIIGAASGDGFNWQKMDPRTRTEGRPYPTLTPTDPARQSYGVGQSSVIQRFDGNGEISHYFWDASLPGMCLAVSEDGGWNFRRTHNPLAVFPPIPTWDFKQLYNGKILGIFGANEYNIVTMPAGRERHCGALGVVISSDGVNFSYEPVIPLLWLLDKGTADSDRMSIQNGGLLGNPRGVIEGHYTVFYCGGGIFTHSRPGEPPIGGNDESYTWDIVAFTIHFKDL